LVRYKRWAWARYVPLRACMDVSVPALLNHQYAYLALRP
jgi:hypothetical protein